MDLPFRAKVLHRLFTTFEEGYSTTSRKTKQLVGPRAAIYTVKLCGEQSGKAGLNNNVTHMVLSDNVRLVTNSASI